MIRSSAVALAIALPALGAGLVMLGGQVWLAGKGALAGILIDRAWQAHLRDGRPHRPWDWADMVPIARLEFPDRQIARTVLAGATGTSMAFGTGHVDGTAPPNQPGNCVLAGHRDGEFAFLEQVEIGDRLQLRTRDRLRDFEVTGISVVRDDQLQEIDRWGPPRVTLVTCYPFGGLTSSRWRYVVEAR